jgi:hypothetical protein
MTPRSQVVIALVVILFGVFIAEYAALDSPTTPKPSDLLIAVRDASRYCFHKLGVFCGIMGSWLAELKRLFDLIDLTNLKRALWNLVEPIIELFMSWTEWFAGFQEYASSMASPVLIPLGWFGLVTGIGWALWYLAGPVQQDKVIKLILKCYWFFEGGVPPQVADPEGQPNSRSRDAQPAANRRPPVPFMDSLFYERLSMTFVCVFEL